MAEVLALFKDMRCSVTGVRLSPKWDGPSRYNPWAPSIDRIDQSRGYVTGNVRPVCWAYNCARQDWPDEVVLAWASSMLGKGVELVQHVGEGRVHLVDEEV